LIVLKAKLVDTAAEEITNGHSVWASTTFSWIQWFSISTNQGSP